ncbi:unnamed protein product, partial [Closterium sp. NIES-53]
AVKTVEVAVDSGAARGAEPVGAGSWGAQPGGARFGGAESGGAEPGVAESEGSEPGGAELGGTGSGGSEPGGAEPGGAESARVASCSPSSRPEHLSSQELREWFAWRWSRAARAGGPLVAPGPGGARTGGTGAVGTGGAAAAAGAGPARASGAAGAGATRGVGAGVGAAGASGAAGAGATGGVGAGVGPVGGTAGATGGPCTYVLRTGPRSGEVCGLPHTTQRCFGHLTDAWRTLFPDSAELPRWHDLLLQNVPIFDLDFYAILAAMYALADITEGDCYLSVPPDPGTAAAALGASAAAALGANASAARGAGESTLSGTAPTEALHTFTLDSGASRSFVRDSTTLTPLSRPVAVSLADPSGGPVLARSSTVLPCPAAPSGLLSGLHLPSFSTNLVSGADLQDAWVDQFTPGGQRVTHCTCSRTGRHLATFTRRPGSSLKVFAAASRSSPASAPCSCRPLSHETLLWHHRLGHPSLPRLRGFPTCTQLIASPLIPRFFTCAIGQTDSLFDLTSGASSAPPATADSTVRSQWATRDATARLAVRRHLPTTERAHFSQYKSAKTLYDAVVARYSSPATAALSRLMLPYLFPDLAVFPIVADLITHLRTSDTRYRAALPADQGPLPLNLPHHTHR